MFSLQGGGDGANGRATGKTGTVKVQSREEAAVAAYSGNGSGSGSSTDEDASSIPPADAATPLGDHSIDCTLARCLFCMSCVLVCRSTFACCKQFAGLARVL